MEEHSPRVSIGLPVYNGERFAAEAINSMLAQTFGDFELLISDNGSTDGTEAICREFASRDPRIRYFREPKNRGLVWNWNRLVELARGEYFKWLAHDDLFAPTYLEKTVQALDAAPDAAWSHSLTGQVDEFGQRISRGDGHDQRSFLFDDQGASGQRLATADAATAHERFRAVLSRSYVGDIFALMRTHVLRKTGLHAPFYGGDKVLIAELSLHGRYKEVPEVLTFLRRHPEQSQWFRSRREQHQMMTGHRGGWILLPRQVLSLLSFTKLVSRTPLPWREKVLCYAEVCRFAVQARKWKRLTVDVLRSVGIRIRVPEDDINPMHDAQSESLAVSGAKAQS